MSLKVVKEIQAKKAELEEAYKKVDEAHQILGKYMLSFPENPDVDAQKIKNALKKQIDKCDENIKIQLDLT